MTRIALALALAATSLSTPLIAHAEPVITGMWALDQPSGETRQPAPKLTPKADTEAKEVARINAKYERVIGEAHTKCWPPGMPGMMQPPFGLEVLQTKGRVTILNEVSPLARTIYLDQAKQPEADGIVPGWNGHSIGKWEGDVLVVQTIGFNDRQPRVSPKTVMTERIFLEPDGHLVDEILTEDPDIYLEPYKVRYRYKPVTEPGQGSELMEYVCEVDPANLLSYEEEQKREGRASSLDPSWRAAHFSDPAPKTAP